MPPRGKRQDAGLLRRQHALEQLVDPPEHRARVLEQARGQAGVVEQLRRGGVRTHLTGAADKPALREYVEARLSPEGWRRIAEPDQLADALEAAEHDVLSRHAPQDPSDGSVPLADHELCRGLSPGELQDLAARLVAIDYPPGTAVVEAGSPSDSMYFVERGAVGIFLGADDSAAALLSTLGPGMSFGEVALVDRDPRSATVRTLEPVRVLRLSFAEFDRLEETGLGHLRSKLVANLASVLAARLRSANREIQSLR